MRARRRPLLAVAALAVLLAACSGSDDAAEGTIVATSSSAGLGTTTAPASTISATTSTTLAATTTTAAATTTVAPATTEAPVTTEPPATTTTVPALVLPIEVVDGRFLGIGYGTMLPDGLAALPQLGQPVPDGDLPFTACTNATFVHYWVTELGALSLVWEGETIDTAHLTNWNYAGGEVDGVPLMVGLDGVTVGSDRASIIASYAGSADDGLFDTIYVDESLLRFDLDGDTVVSMGLIDCGD